MQFPFRGLHGCGSMCDLEIVIHEHKVVVIATEMPHNPGTSVTNAWPFLADAIYHHILLTMCQRHPTCIMWIEHYPANPETWDRVFMDWDGNHFRMAKQQHCWQCWQCWQSLTQQEVEKLKS